ncbi:MAG: sensor histidine kinase [Planctomycetota bacterium]|jgi:signal transduction histidine kinase
MEPISENVRLFGISLQETALYCIAVILAVYNTVMLGLLRHYSKNKKEAPRKTIKTIINFQISADLFILTVLLHFSGGIENPFVFYFIFHMIISSILLSVKESYLQATFAVFLFGFLILLEYLQLIPHYCLEGFVVRCLHRDAFYVLGIYFVFTTALYLVVYMATYIATRLREAEYALRDANIQLTEKDHIKDDYVLRLTHDIKGHLAAIQSCIDVVVHQSGRLPKEKETDFINRAHNRTKQVTRFVRTLLRLTQMRLASNLQMEIFSLKNVIQSVVLAAEDRAASKSIDLKSNIELGPGKMLGDRFSIEEMVANLLLNAIKYTPEKGKVQINATRKDGFFVVEISDTGIGIPADELEHVFDEFYRASNARKIERDGTGLGLSIVKQIIERHNGKIDAKSQEGVGSKFIITLPEARSPNAAD